MTTTVVSKTLLLHTKNQVYRLTLTSADGVLSTDTGQRIPFDDIVSIRPDGGSDVVHKEMVVDLAIVKEAVVALPWGEQAVLYRFLYDLNHRIYPR